MNNILGQFGLGGRLAENIRERQGMAYYAFSSFDPSLGPGPLVIRAGVDPANVERAIAAIDAEVGALGRDGATERELPETRQFLIGSIPRMLETNQSIATFLQTAEFFGLGLDYDRRLPALLQAVTLEDVNAAAAVCCTRSARAWPSRGPPSLATIATRASARQAHDDEGRLLRRRLHADPSRAGVPGAWLRRGVRAARRRDRRRAVRRRGRARPRHCWTREGGVYDPEVFIDYTLRIIEGMGGSGPGADAAARDLYERLVGVPPFHAVRRGARGAARAARRRLHDRPHLEHAAIARRRSRSTSSSTDCSTSRSPRPTTAT